MYDHTFYKQVQISRSDIRPHIKWTVSLVILHMITSIFLPALCGYIWVNILILSPQRGIHLNRNICKRVHVFLLYNIVYLSSNGDYIVLTVMKGKFNAERQCKQRNSIETSIQFIY